tara:strand:+ start:1944 stop:2591 length:648 start_codon:yes stop_codon:yes gene_type:complete
MAIKKLVVPNDMSEITLGQYQKFAKTVEKKNEEEFLQKKMIEIFCDIDLKEVSQYKYSAIKKITKILSEMLEQKPKLKMRFNYKGKELGFIPKIEDLSFGEFVDLDMLMKDWDTMDKALGILYREIENKFSEKYTIVRYNADKIEDMRGMPLDVALGAIFFLQNLKKELMNHTLSYSVKALKSMTPQQKELLQNSMDGSGASLPLVMETLQSLKL